MNLTRLIYISTKNTLRDGEIFRIQEQAQRNNARDELTGVLLFDRSYFLQCLEGEREQVTRTFTVIAADERHRQVNLLHAGDIAARSYPDWSMGSARQFVAVVGGAAGGVARWVVHAGQPDLRFSGASRAAHQRLCT